MKNLSSIIHPHQIKYVLSLIRIFFTKRSKVFENLEKTLASKDEESFIKISQHFFQFFANFKCILKIGKILRCSLKNIESYEFLKKQALLTGCLNFVIKFYFTGKNQFLMDFAKTFCVAAVNGLLRMQKFSSLHVSKFVSYELLKIE